MSLWCDIANRGLDVVGDPLNEVLRVSGLDEEHLVVNVLGLNLSSEHSGSGEVSSVLGVSGSHHVSSVEHLLSQLSDGHGSVGLVVGRCERSESDKEEVETREWNKVDSELAEIGVELSRETEAASDTAHDGGHEVVEISVSGSGELQGLEADFVQGFVINAEDLIGVFNKLVNREGGIVGFDDGVRDLWGWNDGECAHHLIRELFLDLSDEQGTHTGSSSSSERVADLESLEAVSAFSFLANDIEDGLDELSSFCVVSLGPVVTSTILSKDEVVRSEQSSNGSRLDGVHGSWLEIDQDSSWDVFASICFVEVDIDSFQLKRILTSVLSGGVNSVFLRDGLPELSSDLVTALACLDVDDFTHFEVWII